MMKLFLISVFLTIHLSLLISATDEDALYILIDSARLFNCEGVDQKLDIALKDVLIRDENGRHVNYLKAPGEYSIHFRRIKVLEDLGHLSGELSVTLQVPIFEGPAGIRFDLPYQAIPETGLFHQKCDNESGIIQRNNRPFCRYCDLCLTTQRLEENLASGKHKFLPELGSKGNEEKFGHICHQVDGDTYEIFRTVRLPGRKELEDEANKRFGGITGDLRQRLNKQHGKIQVFLNLLSSSDKPKPQAKYYARQQDCRCCGEAVDLACKYFPFLHCRFEQCKSDHAKQCLPDSSQLAACYISEFNYRVTENFADVQEFLRVNGIKEEEVKPQVVNTTPPPPVRKNVRKSTKTSEDKEKSNPECIRNIKANHLRKYCEKFWKRPFCCSKCKGFC